MKIDYLQVSNILSFRYVADVSQAEKLTFDHGLNIIIGENGSGKSTALEIINFLFKRVLYRQYNVNQDLFDRRHDITADERRQILLPANLRSFSGFRLDPNWDSEGEGQRIRIALKLDDIDHQNIRNLRAHFSQVTRAIGLYSSHTVADDGVQQEHYVLDVVLNKDSKNFDVKFESGAQDFGFQYLSEYHFFKEAIAIHNLLHADENIPPLYESFTLISSYRNYHAFEPSISLRDAHPAQQIQKIRSQDYNRSLNASDKTEPPIFALVRLQVAERHFNLISQDKSVEQCEKEANDLKFVRSINERLRVVGLECKIRLTDLRTWQYSFEFVDTRRGKLISDINSLSAGQKAIIHLVFEAYGRGDLKGGVVIIDEPEIHLHYQFQHEYLQVIDDLNRDQKCQYILVTHSEALINSRTINSVRRFSLGTHGQTKIFSPQLTADEKSLIKILDNTRSTYAFFAKKVMLVEGDTDRYFFRAVIQERYRSLDQEIAVLHIGGKGEFAKWRELFSCFGLSVSVVADFDYIINLCYQQEKGVSLKTQEAVASFKQRHPDWEAKIDAGYQDGIFVFKEGDLEAYLNIRKDLGATITFCRDNLRAFLNDDASSKSKEVRVILERIAK
ncbi:MAG: AAA family ATPase [Caldilineaceae bacterium]|nr:AAA family ATPase [Caldilineaceae bacterium]